MRFADDSRFAPSRSAVWRELDGRAYVLDGVTGDHYETNAVGGAIFRLAAEGRALASIRAALLASFAVEPAELEADLERYLDELIARGLLSLAA